LSPSLHALDRGDALSELTVLGLCPHLQQDKLQDGVPEAIFSLRGAGIKVRACVRACL